jgi:3-oxoacyl-(acyl-carrier-protein) synthase
MALENDTLPPSRNCDEPDPACAIALATDGPQTLAGAEAIMVNAVGAFGEAASLLLARAS